MLSVRGSWLDWRASRATLSLRHWHSLDKSTVSNPAVGAPQLATAGTQLQLFSSNCQPSLRDCSEFNLKYIAGPFPRFARRLFLDIYLLKDGRVWCTDCCRPGKGKVPAASSTFSLFLRRRFCSKLHRRHSTRTTAVYWPVFSPSIFRSSVSTWPHFEHPFKMSLTLFNEMQNAIQFSSPWNSTNSISYKELDIDCS